MRNSNLKNQKSSIDEKVIDEEVIFVFGGFFLLLFIGSGLGCLALWSQWFNDRDFNAIAKAEMIFYTVMAPVSLGIGLLILIRGTHSVNKKK